MRKAKYIATAAVLMAAGLASVAGSSAHAATNGPLTGGGSVNVANLKADPGLDGGAGPELGSLSAREAAEGGAPAGGPGAKTDSARLGSAGSEVKASFQGLNHRQQRLASNGNQFSLEPPDQALCAGNGFVVEAVNDAVRVYDKAGTALTPTIALNEFYGYAPSINRTTLVRGPEPTDPVCHYDSDTGRFFLVILTLDQFPGGGFTGANHLDIAVSDSSDPTSTWHTYKLAVQNDGTDGTPDHHCDGGPCIGDYPHIGADRNGIYLTTNEYAFFGDGYNGSQIYAISKADLVSGAATPKMQVFESPALGPFRSFTVWPSISPAGKASTANGGTEFFLSTTLGDGSETGNTATSEKRIGAWQLTNTSSLNSATPNLRLANKLINAKSYSMPPAATQKAGPHPLGECINDTTSATPFGPGCWNFLFVGEPAHSEVEGGLDSGDGRMQQVVYADGVAYGSFGTAVTVDGANDTKATRAGVEWVAVKMTSDGGRFSPEVKQAGYVGRADADITYPALGLTKGGKIVLGVTVSGENLYPSAAYVQVGGETEKPTVKIIAQGAGPNDSFGQYAAFGSGRSRWGDYGAAAMDGDTLWLANEYIAQSCTLEQYMASPFGSCGGTRTSLSNWSTHIAAIKL
jgi:hypothetical protein